MEITRLKDLGFDRRSLEVIFDYLFRKISIREFKDYFPDSLQVKRHVDSCGYILLNCKLYAYAHHVAVRDGTKLPNPRNYDIHPHDTRFLRSLDLSHIPKEYISHSLKGFQDSLSMFVTSSHLDTLLNKIISKKMRFMIKSYGDTRHDLDMSMRVAAIYNIYRVYPYFKSYLHMCNVGKGAARRHGHTLIKQRTTLKSQRLMKNTDGTHQARLIPLAAVHHSLRQEEQKDISMEILEAVINKCSPRVRRFFYLMSGNFDEGFSEFLGQNNKEAALEMRFDTYRAQVQKYLEVTPAQVTNLFQRLQQRYLVGNCINVNVNNRVSNEQA